VLASLLFMRRMAEVAQARLIDAAHPAAPPNLPRGVFIYDISGPLFFGATQKAMATLGVVDKARAVILEMSGVPAMDATGLVALESALEQLRDRGCLCAIVGLQPQPQRVLANAGIVERPGVLILRADVDAVLQEIDPPEAHSPPAPGMN
jgi:SulP family sulfate permease